MNSLVVDKFELTKRIFSLLNEGTYTKSDIEVALYRWWSNIRPGGGLKLTDQGDLAFNRARIENFDYRLEISSSVLLKLDRYMVCPYYIILNKSTLRIYDDKIAMMITLHGTIQNYINSLEVKRTDLSISSKQ